MFPKFHHFNKNRLQRNKETEDGYICRYKKYFPLGEHIYYSLYHILSRKNKITTTYLNKNVYI